MYVCRLSGGGEVGAGRGGGEGRILNGLMLPNSVRVGGWCCAVHEGTWGAGSGRSEENEHSGMGSEEKVMRDVGREDATKKRSSVMRKEFVNQYAMRTCTDTYMYR